MEKTKTLTELLEEHDRLTEEMRQIAARNDRSEDAAYKALLRQHILVIDAVRKFNPYFYHDGTTE
jgi:hypothetical protein